MIFIFNDVTLSINSYVCFIMHTNSAQITIVDSSQASFFSPSKGHALRRRRIRKKEEKDVRHPHLIIVFIAKNPCSGETHSNMNLQKFVDGTIVVISK